VEARPGHHTTQAHVERMFVVMALVTWLAIYAELMLAQPLTGQRRTRLWLAKHSLFTLGLHW